MSHRGGTLTLGPRESRGLRREKAVVHNLLEAAAGTAAVVGGAAAGISEGGGKWP